MDDAYGTMIRLNLVEGNDEEILHRVPLGTPTSQGNIIESKLQELLFRNPQTLPIGSIDKAHDGVIPVCQELYTPAGYVDALYINNLGRLTIAEFKLWRNPQARREVIGQILDYAKELAAWSYEDLQREVSRALRKKGNVLHELVCARYPETDESAFVDNVTRHLRRGEFLLLIIGDGIREDVENIVDFVQVHSGLHFNLALVEAALYSDTHGRIIIQPRTIARTELVKRLVFETGEAVDLPPDDTEDKDELSNHERENLRYWAAVLEGYSFSDVTVEVPTGTKESNLYVRVNSSESGRWDLYFAGYLNRSSSKGIGCYLMRNKNNPHAVHIYEQLWGAVDELREEMGDDLDRWVNKSGNPRIGFHRKDRLPFELPEDSAEFLESVDWMQKKLDLLVSTLHPRLKGMLRNKV